MGRTSVASVLYGDNPEVPLIGQQPASLSIPVVIASGSPAAATAGLLFVAIAVSASGATALVAANATRKIKVVSYVVVASGAVSVKFQSGSTDISGFMPFAANGGVEMAGVTTSHILETAVNQALNINLSGAVAVGGHLSYFLEA